MLLLIRNLPHFTQMFWRLLHLTTSSSDLLHCIPYWALTIDLCTSDPSSNSLTTYNPAFWPSDYSTYAGGRASFHCDACRRLRWGWVFHKPFHSRHRSRQWDHHQRRRGRCYTLGGGHPQARVWERAVGREADSAQLPWCMQNAPNTH